MTTDIMTAAAAASNIDAIPADMFERLIRALNVAYFEWIAGSDDVRVSAVLADMFGFAPNTWSTQRQLELMHPDDMHEHRAALIAYLRSGKDRAQFSYRVRDANGPYRWVLTHNLAERDATGRVTRMTGTVSDITEAKQREAENSNLIARQAASIEVLRTISASHDDPRPVFELIAEIAIAADLRAEIGDLIATLKSNLAKIAQHGRRADSIVKNMLLHSRSGSSEHRAIDLNTTVEEALNLAYHGARAETPGFNITLEKDLDPQAGTVDLYPQEFIRVMLNLIGNGFYAARNRANRTADKGFEPTLRLATRDMGDQVEIRVRDNGTGISDAVRDKIFEPFFTTKPAGEGTGLGLSLSYDIVVKQHGGQLYVDSKADAFSEFVITLPRKTAAVADARGDR
jgi:PAS domain S-box-containing protein